MPATGTVLMAALRCPGPGRAGLDSSGGAGSIAPAGRAAPPKDSSPPLERTCLPCALRATACRGSNEALAMGTALTTEGQLQWPDVAGTYLRQFWFAVHMRE